MEDATMRINRSVGLVTAVLVAGFSLARPIPAAAQGQAIVTVDYMKVAPGQDDAYLQVEQKMWKPIHEARVKAGNALGWYLYRVASPSGTLVDHNYVTVAIYSSFEATENPFSNELLAKIVPAQSAAEFMKKTLASRDLVRSELWGTITTTPERPLAKPARFLNVQYMKVPIGGDAAYLEIEKLWKKMHDVRIKEGTLANWGVYGRILPGGSDYPYNYVTADGYSHYKDIFGLDFPTVLQKAALGMSANELGERTEKARDLVRGEVWELIDYVQAPPK
jgi:hypothetical protein